MAMGFSTKHVFAGQQGLARQGEMGARRRGDDHRLDAGVLPDIFQAGGGAHAGVERGDFGQPAGVQVTAGGEDALRKLMQVAGQVRPPVSVSD
jgi:hypothetical protein